MADMGKSGNPAKRAQLKARDARDAMERDLRRHRWVIPPWRVYLKLVEAGEEQDTLQMLGITPWRMAQPGVPPYWESLHNFYVEGKVDDLATAQCLTDMEFSGLLVWDDAAQIGRMQVTPRDAIAMFDALPNDSGARI